MTTLCSRADVRLMIHENFRWRAWYLRMKEEMDRGTVGRPFRLRLAMYDQRCLRPGGLSLQPYFADMARLILYEIGPHAIDLARFFFGEPTWLACTLQHVGRQRGEDLALVTLGYPDRTAVLDLSWATATHHSRPEWGLFETWLEAEGQLRRELNPQSCKRKHVSCWLCSQRLALPQYCLYLDHQSRPTPVASSTAGLSVGQLKLWVTGQLRAGN